jgi:hypothetical protein
MCTMAHCLCECLSTVWMQLRHRIQSPEVSLDSLVDSLSSRLVQIELLDRRCVSEARRHHASGSRALFRAKMLEHRRLQTQLLQLQRYKENVHAQLDAASHHAINQTFMRAMAINKNLFSREDAENTISDIQESVSNAKEMTELLGQPIDAGVDVTDEDLEEEFMESLRGPPTTADAILDREMPALPPHPVASSMTALPVAVPSSSRQLVLPATMA